MSNSHNNQLNMASLFDEEYPPLSHKRDYDMARYQSNNPYRSLVPGQGPPSASVKVEEGVAPVSYTLTYDSDNAESDCEDQWPSKIPKINKDGVPRKPRQPRPKLLKWSDNDWKNVVLGIVWACGETGVQIPFDQAAQVVGDSCTAGALQQAILKLRGKQIDEGYEIPSLRMAWTRKNKRASSSSSSTNAVPQQSTGQGQGQGANRMVQPCPSLIVKLKATVPTSVVPKKASVLPTQNVTPQPGGFGFPFNMTNDIHCTGGQGLIVVNGLPTVPTVFDRNYPDIVPQAVPTQYKRGAGIDFNFDKYEQEQEAHDYAEDVKDHQEWDMVGNDSQEDLLAASETALVPPSGFLPGMSSSMNHTYDSPYSFDGSRLHSLDSPSPSQQGLQGVSRVPPRIDVGHFPDLFAHDVYANCGFEYDFNAGH